jgi:AN1-type zinc finger protein 5/6
MNEDKTISPITKDKKHKKKIIRCKICRQKCTLIRFECKCKGVFCSVHRYTHSHNCDYIEQKKEEKKKEIENNNPKVETKKINEI